MLSTRLFKITINISSILIITFTSIVAVAQNRVVVIPMSGEDLKPLQNVITVALSNGDFTSPNDALASITDASATNPYLVVIAPGVYTLPVQLVMKEYVEISGSGTHATVLRGSVSSEVSSSSASALVVGSNNASLSALRIENIDGPNAFSIGVFSDGLNNLDLFDLSIFLSGGASQTGLGLLSSSISLLNSKVKIAQGSANSVGVSFIGSTGALNNVGIDVRNANFQQGVQIASASSVNVTDTTITVAEGANPVQGSVISTSSSGIFSNTSINVSSDVASPTGILITGASSATITGSRVAATGSFPPEGINVNTADSFARIRSSNVTASTRSLRANVGTGANETLVSDSTLDGPVSGDPVCSFVHTSAGVLLDSGCSAL